MVSYGPLLMLFLCSINGVSPNIWRLRLKPLLSYYGGKQRMMSKILPLFPGHSTYVEPFCGGATMLFGKAPSGAEVINDLNKDLITLYRVAKTPGLRDQLVERLRATLYSKAEHQKAIAIYKNGGEDDVTTAWALYVNGCMSFANKFNGGWGFDRQGGSKQVNAWRSKLAQLDEQLLRIESVYIECDDAIKIIKKYDRPSTLFYCDPPYVGTECGHYGGYLQSDLQALLDTLEGVQGSFVLSGYDNPAINPQWEHLTFDSSCSAAHGGQGHNRNRTEHVWRKSNAVSEQQTRLLLA